MAVSPIMTAGTAANLIASGSVAATASTPLTPVDLSTKFEGQIMVAVTFANVASPAKATVLVYDSTIAGDATNPLLSVDIPGVQNVQVFSSVIKLPTGKYKIKVTNTDGSNAQTIAATLATVDSVG